MALAASGSSQAVRRAPDVLLNVAATCGSTHALGPGLRAAVWVQGCPFDCPGCIAPDWIPIRRARKVTPAALTEELLRDERVTGLTFSGGEPMMQAEGLASLIRYARQRRDLSLLCFTGFRLEDLRASPPVPGVGDLLGEVDVLIDGQYVARLNDGRGLRGSSNQRVHFLTDRLRGADLEASARRAEVRVGGRELMLIGVPPRGLTTEVTRAQRRARQAQTEECGRHAGPMVGGGPA